MATYTGADKAIAFLFDIAASIAADYDATSTYEPDAYAIYDGTLYKCTAAISTPETFNPAHWQAVLVMDEIAAGGGGGGGTTVIANPSGAATDILNKLQVGATIYSLPSGGGGESNEHNYNANEQIAGTWIDGSILYEKTVTFGAITSGSRDYAIATGLSNVDKIICYWGTIYNSAGTQYRQIPMPLFVTNEPTYSFAVRRYNKTNNTINVDVGSNVDVGGGWFVIQYTKTIDTTVYDRALENDTDIRTTEDGNTRQTENTLGV